MNQKYTHDQFMLIAENMKTYGGSFVKCIAECIYTADDNNKKKLVEAFPEYFERYLNF